MRRLQERQNASPIKMCNFVISHRLQNLADETEEVNAAAVDFERNVVNRCLSFGADAEHRENGKNPAKPVLLALLDEVGVLAPERTGLDG